MNVVKNDDGDITLESEDHSISFSWNRQVTPEDKQVESTNKMISDVMNTPRSKSLKFDDMEKMISKEKIFRIFTFINKYLNNNYINKYI